MASWPVAPVAWGMGGCLRLWSADEQRELFQHYFDSLPSVCQICSQNPHFRMHHTSELVLLSACCPGCGNMALLFFGGIIGLPAQASHHESQKL